MSENPRPDTGSERRATRVDQRLRVLLVEDDKDLREVLVSSLELAGIEVQAVREGEAGLSHHRSDPADLILLDVALPGRSGFEVASELRDGRDPTPIIFLTARDALRDKLAGFQAGGDDYITKPFELAELIARIRAVAGRATRKEATLTCGDLLLDRDRHEVRKAGEVVHLTATEFRLISYLMENQGRVLRRQDIRDAVWDYPSDDTSVVENYISFLRRKLDTTDPALIRTIRGVGYTLRDD